MYGNSVKLVFDLDELRYYFDAEQRDSIDRGGISRKSGEVLALREKMVLLPDQKFDLAMKTMKKIMKSGLKISTMKLTIVMERLEMKPFTSLSI